MNPPETPTADRGNPIQSYLRQIRDVFRTLQAGSEEPGPETPTRSYLTLQDFVEDRGHAPREEALTADELGSIELAHVLGRKTVPFNLKACFANAQTLSFCTDETVRYVEGFATTGILPVHHAWVEIGGKVVDLTWGPKRNGKIQLPTIDHGEAGIVCKEPGGWRSRVLGLIPEGWVYFGVDLTDHIDFDRLGGSVLDDWEGRWPLLHWSPRITLLPALDEGQVRFLRGRA